MIKMASWQMLKCALVVMTASFSKKPGSLTHTSISMFTIREFYGHESKSEWILTVNIIQDCWKAILWSKIDTLWRMIKITQRQMLKYAFIVMTALPSQFSRLFVNDIFNFNHSLKNSFWKHMLNLPQPQS